MYKRQRILRLAVPDIDSVNTVYALKKNIGMPIVADIHFDYKLALSLIHIFSGVANNSVVPEIFDGEIRYKKVYEELTCTVTSMRLDCMTAAVTARSRSEAENMVLTGTVRLNGIETVSYTHLDVYKRQVEYVVNKKKIGAKTLFATHYHELCELADTVEGLSLIHIYIRQALFRRETE